MYHVSCIMLACRLHISLSGVGRIVPMKQKRGQLSQGLHKIGKQLTGHACLVKY